MVHEVDVEVGILIQDQLAIGRALVVERIVRHRRECRLQLRQRVHRGLRPRIFLAVERKAAVLAIDRNEALLEVSALDRGIGALLAFQPECIDVLPRNAFEGGDRIGADALVRLRMPRAQAQIAVVHHERPLAAPAFHRHHLGAAGDHEVFGTRHDGVGRHVDAGDAGAAEAIERNGAGAHVVTGIERRHPAEIAALLAALRTGAPDDVVDVGGVDPGALGQRPQHGGAQLLRVNARQRALAGLANAPRRPACVDDQRVHGVSPQIADLSGICRPRDRKVNSRRCRALCNSGQDSTALERLNATCQRIRAPRRRRDRAARMRQNGRPSASPSSAECWRSSAPSICAPA